MLLLVAGTLWGCALRNYVHPAFASQDSGITGQLVHARSENGKLQPSSGAAGRVMVRTADHTQLAASVDTDADGKFNIPLRPGNYFVYTEISELGVYGRNVAVHPHQLAHITVFLPPGQGGS